VVLKSAKNQFLGVDTSGQHVPLCVQYETTCLLIRNAIGYVSYSVEWGCASFFVSYFMKMPEPHGARGPFAGKSLALQAGSFARESIAKHDILL
jgi:hypothetical protein